MTVAEAILTLLEHPMDAELVTTSNDSEFYPRIRQVARLDYDEETLDMYDLERGKEYVAIVTAEYWTK